MRLTTLFAKKTWNYGWVVIGTLVVIDAMVMGVTFTLGIMLPVISNDLGMDLRQAGWLGAMNWEVTAILTIPLAFRFARFSPKKTVIVSCACQVILLFAHGLAPNYWFLLVSRIAFMASGLIRFAANPMLVQQWFPRNRFALVNTVSTVCSGLAGGTVVFFMGDLLDALNGWRNIFFIFGVINALLLFAWVRLGKENPLPGIEDEVKKAEGIKVILKNKTLWLLGIGITGDMLCFGAMETLWPKYATSLGFISLDKAAYCEGLSYFGFTVGSLLGGLLSIRLGRRKPAIWISGLLLPFVTLGILFSRSFAALAFLWAMWGVCELYFPVVFTIPYELPGIRPKQVPVASAFVVSVFTAGAGLGPILGSYLAGIIGSLERALLVICIFPILLFMMGLAIKETGPAIRKLDVVD
jgi:predicted MFS family arabinose efflux permease